VRKGRSVLFRQQVNIGLLVLAFLLILGTSAFSVTSTNALGDSIQLVNHTRTTLGLIGDMQVELGSIESSGLRYMVAGDAEQQMIHRTAIARIGRMTTQLAHLIKDNPLQRSYVADFTQQIEALQKRSNKSLEIKRQAIIAGDELGPIRRIRQSKSSGMMKDMHTTLTHMASEENRLMIARGQERDALVKQANATVLITNALALVAGVLGFLAIRRSQLESENLLLARIQAEQARRASEEKSAFLANMSHEIRTPMNAIFGFTQLLSDSVTAPQEREWVLSIKKSGNLLLGLINDVLDLSKIEAGKMRLTVQPTDIREVINETVVLFKPMAAEKGIFLTHEADVSVNEPLMLDSQRLRQVLINLLSNAVKYTERGGVVVRLMMTPAADRLLRNLRLLITDSGVGIDPEQVQKIFEPFHQAESPDGKVRQGTGLGLSISQRLVDLMNGNIKVTSELGKGTTFMVEILNVSVADTMPVANELIEAKADFNHLPRLKILVVDDVEWNTEIAVGFFSNSHHEVHVANSGLAGVAAAKTLKPDLILMDLRMPGMSGFEANDAIRSDPELQDKPIAIVALTAASPGEDEKTLTESFDGYVRKPYTPIELFNALDAIFNSPQSHVQVARAPLTWTPALRTRWQQLQGSHLAELRSSMRIREIGDYAQQLHKFASEAQFDLLRTKALTLQRAVQQFDITAVTAVLTDLAGWPEDFDDA
jgi:signal transduction histidine kinase/DNA-binding response OmpR family regulator